MSTDAPLEPVAWEAVHHALRRMYIGFWLVFFGCGIGLIPMFIGHRDLARNGPTERVQAISRARMWLIPFTIVASIFGTIVDAGTDSDAMRLAGVVPLALATVAEFALWSELGLELSRWAGSAVLLREWRRARIFILSGIVAMYAAVAVWVLGSDDFRPVALVAAVAMVVLSIGFLHTTWRTYSLFKKPLVAAYAAVAPPPPSGRPTSRTRSATRVIRP